MFFSARALILRGVCAVLHKECINVTILQMCVSREQIYSRFFKGMGRVLTMLAQSFAVQFIFIALDVTGVLLSHCKDGCGGARKTATLVSRDPHASVLTVTATACQISSETISQHCLSDENIPSSAGHAKICLHVECKQRTDAISRNLEAMLLPQPSVCHVHRTYIYISQQHTNFIRERRLFALVRS